MGIKSVAVFSDADRDAPFVQDADMAVHIGPSTVSKSYLDQQKIVGAAKAVGANAIHPGYGFLSENADFAELCEQNNIIWIGPNPKAINAMGSKSEAKRIMQSNGVPTVPGYQGDDQSNDLLKEEAMSIGFPVLLKATTGGGGKGMRIVHQESELVGAIESAKRESKHAFGSEELIIEKYINSGRHIEFQIFGDKHGNVIHLFERECSIQRRYQKVMEESPSPVMTLNLQNKMSEAAINAAKALNYDNAGTVEFIFDDKSGDFYFLEINTRLQVEHPVTEEITGLDLVQMQIESAQGFPLSISQENLSVKGYSIELRLYAENPENNFLPETGIIHLFSVPKINGFRLESTVKSGSEISIYYDPMIAKLIVTGNNRLQALSKMKYVLENLVCLGVTTNQRFLLELMKHQDIINGEYNTHFIQNEFGQHISFDTSVEFLHECMICASLYQWNLRQQKRTLLTHLPSGWRNSPYQDQFDKYSYKEDEYLVNYKSTNNDFHFTISENEYIINDLVIEGNSVQFTSNGIRKKFSIATDKDSVYIHHPQASSIRIELQARLPLQDSEDEKGSYIAPMPSQVISVLVKKGDQVTSGTALIVLSSMKMENTITAHEDGIVQDVYVTSDQSIPSGTELINIKSVE